MKYHEIKDGVPIVVWNEEAEIKNRISNSKEGSIASEKLNEREELMAFNMLRKGLLTRTSKSGKVYYKIA